MSDRIEFNDGAAYEHYMGVWSRSAGEVFLDWLSPPPGIDWLDVGCGNGAFTELIVERCMPCSIAGVDPSDAQLDHARSRPALADARLLNGDSMALPFPDDSFDAAVMPLVIFFVPEPERGVAEMTRVVRSGGIVSAYGWDLPDGGFPYFPLIDELELLGASAPRPPSPYAATVPELERLWHGAALTDVVTCTITVERRFESTEDLLRTVGSYSTVGKLIAQLDPDAQHEFQQRIRQRLPMDDCGRITLTARANAVRGRVT